MPFRKKVRPPPAALLSSPADSRDAVIPALRKVDKSSASQPGVLEGALKDGSDPLERLLPETAAVGYLFILCVSLSSGGRGHGELTRATD